MGLNNQWAKLSWHFHVSNDPCRIINHNAGFETKDSTSKKDRDDMIESDLMLDAGLNNLEQSLCLTELVGNNIGTES